MGTLIALRLRERCFVRGGAMFNAGELVALSPAEAQTLLASGVAVLAETKEEKPAMPTKATTQPKAPDRPPQDKMIRRAPWQKGGRG